MGIRGWRNISKQLSYNTGDAVRQEFVQIIFLTDGVFLSEGKNGGELLGYAV